MHPFGLEPQNLHLVRTRTFYRCILLQPYWQLVHLANLNFRSDRCHSFPRFCLSSHFHHRDEWLPIRTHPTPSRPGRRRRPVRPDRLRTPSHSLVPRSRLQRLLHTARCLVRMFPLMPRHGLCDLFRRHLKVTLRMQHIAMGRIAGFWE